jgi:hypothetical protein
MKSSKQADDRQNEQMDVVALIEVINAGGEMRDLQSFHAILASYRGIYRSCKALGRPRTVKKRS